MHSAASESLQLFYCHHKLANKSVAATWIFKDRVMDTAYSRTFCLLEVLSHRLWESRGTNQSKAIEDSLDLSTFCIEGRSRE